MKLRIRFSKDWEYTVIKPDCNEDRDSAKSVMDVISNEDGFTELVVSDGQSALTAAVKYWKKGDHYAAEVMGKKFMCKLPGCLEQEVYRYMHGRLNIATGVDLCTRAEVIERKIAKARRAIELAHADIINAIKDNPEERDRECYSG